MKQRSKLSQRGPRRANRIELSCSGGIPGGGWDAAIEFRPHTRGFSAWETNSDTGRCVRVVRSSHPPKWRRIAERRPVPSPYFSIKRTCARASISCATAHSGDYGGLRGRIPRRCGGDNDYYCCCGRRFSWRMPQRHHGRFPGHASVQHRLRGKTPFRPADLSPAAAALSLAPQPHYWSLRRAR
jgi:hypothetical protein